MELHTLILVVYQWTTLTSHVPTLCAPLGEKRSGELSQICAYSPKLMKTDEIVRSLRSTSLTTIKFVHLLLQNILNIARLHCRKSAC